MVVVLYKMHYLHAFVVYRVAKQFNVQYSVESILPSEEVDQQEVVGDRCRTSVSSLEANYN